MSVSASEVAGDGVVRIEIGDVTLTRVPYFDIAVDPGVVGLTAEQVRDVPWSVPVWATPTGEVRVGQAIWVAESDGQAVVVDPCGAADDFLRVGEEAVMHQERVLDAMACAGYPADRIDEVVLTHLDGIGMAAAVGTDGEWQPMFPDARVVMTKAELDWLATDPEVSGLDALRALVRHGVVDGVGTRHHVAPGMCLESTGGHSRGHAVLTVQSANDRAVLLGHLAVSPVHFATGPCESMHEDPSGAQRLLQGLLDEAITGGTVLIGPLWPAPGAAIIGADGSARPVT